MRPLSRWSLLCLSAWLWPAVVRADPCDDKCATAKTAAADADAKAAKTADDAKTSRAVVDIQQQDVTKIEKAIADAKQAKTDALNELAKPRTKRRRAPDAQKLAQAVKDADQAIEEGLGKLEAARAVVKKSEDTAKIFDDTAARAKADADAARKNYEDCRAKCTAVPAEPKAGAAPAPEAPRSGEGPSPSGISVGARLSGGLPFGAVQQGSPIDDSFAAVIPLQLDLGWRFSERLYLGAYLAYGVILRAKGGCKNATSCSSSELRFGLGGEYHFPTEASFKPWLGLGAGYEISSTSGTLEGGADQSGSVSGFEFGHLEGGVDFRALPRVIWGPYASFSVGEYTQGSSGGTLTGLRLHEWAMLGLRGRFDAM
jgi:hypothetical protein